MNKTASLTALTLAVLWVVHGQSQEAKDGVQLQVVKYPGLKEIIQKNQGKVVLVDFWGDLCPPCKKGFPKIVKIHQKYAKDGLAVVSVSLDEAGAEGIQDRVLSFLKKQGANFTNVLLDEPSTFWQEKLHFTGPPCYFVFNRQGKWTKFQPAEDDPEKVYVDIENFVAENLKQK